MNVIQILTYVFNPLIFMKNHKKHQSKEPTTLNS